MTTSFSIGDSGVDFLSLLIRVNPCLAVSNAASDLVHPISPSHTTSSRRADGRPWMSAQIDRIQLAKMIHFSTMPTTTPQQWMAQPLPEDRMPIGMSHFGDFGVSFVATVAGRYTSRGGPLLSVRGDPRIPQNAFFFFSCRCLAAGFPPTTRCIVYSINGDDLVFGAPLAIDDPANVWYLPPVPTWFVNDVLTTRPELSVSVKGTGRSWCLLTFSNYRLCLLSPTNLRRASHV